MKTALFGGTFNPIHSGHVKMIKDVLLGGFADTVLVMPANIPPHKESCNLAQPHHRINMCKEAVKDIASVMVSDLEINRGAKSYTIDTILSLKDTYSDLCLICGGDMIKTFNTWHRYEDILKLCDIIAFRRSGTDDEDFLMGVNSIKNAGGKIIVSDTDIMDISSTQIRQNIVENKPLQGILPSAVEKYIRDNNLYTGR